MKHPCTVDVPASSARSSRRLTARRQLAARWLVPLLVGLVGQPLSVRAAAAAEEKTETLKEFEVKEKKAFTDENVDIVRTIDDPQPYYILGADQIATSGAVNVETFLKNKLTMNTLARSNMQTAPNYQGAQTAINLRGVGSNQTLVLINGRRTSTVALLGLTTQPDINGIPLGIIDRIEVLPSSSAAIYGGSAIGGVVNVVFKHDYNGGDVKTTYKNTFDSDAPIRTVDATYGLSFGKTHVMVGAHYSDSKAPVVQDRPELYQAGLARVLANNRNFLQSVASPFLYGSTTNIASANGAALTLKPEYGSQTLSSLITYIPTGTSASTAKTTLGTGLAANAGSYNFNLADTYYKNGFQGQVSSVPKTKSVIASVRHELTSRITVFSEFFNSTSYARSNTGIYSGTFRISASAPTNPFTQDVNVTFPDPTGAAYFGTNNVTRSTTGVVMSLPWEWQAEADYTWNFNRYNYHSGLYDSVSAFTAALNAGTVNPFLDTMANRQPLTPYIGTFGSQQPSTLNNVGLRAAGPLFKLPGGAPTLSLGLEHRKEGMAVGYFFRSFPNAPANSLYRYYLGQAQSTNSGYAELKVPIISKANALPFLRELELQGAVRSEKFKVGTGSTFVTVGTPSPVTHSESRYTSTNPTMGLSFRPIDDILVRASYGTGFLPPDYAQFLPATLGGVSILGPNATTTVIDPKRGNVVTTINYISGGNANVKPQESDNYNVGVVYEPRFVKGLRLNVEWYRLKQENVAVTPTAQLIVNNESAFPSRVTRGAVQAGDPFGVGSITLVDFSLLSANKAETEGYDFSIGYRTPASDIGTFDLNVLGTVIKSFKQQTVINAPLTELVNQVAYGGPLKRKGNATLSWTKGNWNAGATVRYFGSYSQYNVGGVTTYLLAQGSATIPSQTYTDVFVNYAFGSRGGRFSERWLKNTSVQVGVSNVFNKTPAFDAYYSDSYYYSPFGDPRISDYWISVSKKF